jgi:hypothetical protein
MDVEMPDGTIIEGVPEGTSKQTLLSMLQRSKVGAAVDKGKRDLANSLPWYEAAMVGAGKGADSVWGGMKQIGTGLVGAAANALPDSGIKRGLEDYATQQAGAISSDQEDKAREYAPLAEQRPYATGFGEALPMLAIPGGAAVRGAKGMEMLANAAAQGAVPGLLGYGTAEERGARGLAGAAGGAVGGALGAGIGRAIQPFRPAMNEARTAALDAAERFGLKLTPAELSNSRALKWAQAAVDDLPFASGMGTARREGNAQALNKAALATIGESGSEITPTVLAGAKTRLGGEYEALFKEARIPVGDDALLSKLGGIVEDANKFLPKEQARVVSNRVDDLLSKAGNDSSIPGFAYQKWRASATSKDGDVNHYLKQARTAVDESATAALSAEKMAAYGQTNRQYANLKALNTGNVVNRETGSVAPKQLDNYLANKFKDAYREGRAGQDLGEVAKAGMLLREMPNSGSVPRLAYTGGMGGGGVGMAAGMIDPITFGAAALSPAFAQIAMNNPLARRYASKGMFAVTPEMERMLIRGGAYPAAGTAMSLYGGGK